MTVTHRFVDTGADGPPGPIAEVVRELLDLLARLVPYRSALISVYDPLTRSHRTMGRITDDAPLTDLDVFEPGAGPPSWTDDTLRLPLVNPDGSYTGTLYLSPAVAPVSDAEREAVTDQLMRTRSFFGGLIDAMWVPSQLAADVPAGAHGAVVLPDATVVPLPGRLTGEHLHDGGPLPRAITAAARRGDLPERSRWTGAHADRAWIHQPADRRGVGRVRQDGGEARRAPVRQVGVRIARRRRGRRRARRADRTTRVGVPRSPPGSAARPVRCASGTGPRRCRPGRRGTSRSSTARRRLGRRRRGTR